MLFAIHWNLKYFKCDEFFRHIIEWCNLILRTHSNPKHLRIMATMHAMQRINTNSGDSSSISSGNLFYQTIFVFCLWKGKLYNRKQEYHKQQQHFFETKSMRGRAHRGIWTESHFFVWFVSCFFFIFIWWKLTNATWKKWITSIIKCEFSKKQYDGIKSEQNTKKLDGTGRNIN